MRDLGRRLLILAALTVAPPLGAEEPVEVPDPAKARVDYMLNCQGCHGPDGAGTADGAVPTMQRFVGYFLHVEGGREYLVQVPGSYNSPLTDGELARVLNWMLVQMSAGQLPQPFEPFTASEVAVYRSTPLEDVAAARALLLRRIGDAGLGSR